MKIYKSEAGIDLSNNKICYASTLLPTKKEPANIERIKAALKTDNPSLYPLESVLVSVGWNLNDDVFSKMEVWNARKTPEDTPFNIEHNQKHIIGHITGNWVVDNDYNVINDETNVPEFYHILTSSVIYKSWEDKEYEDEINKIIGEIENGGWSVSMECLFNDFDYAVITPDGQTKIIARNDDSSFLTKRLRSYGGDGVYDGYKIGRYLKNITFSGKGLVRKPANPNSIIFNKVNKFNGTYASLVYFNNNDVLKTVSSENKSMDSEKRIADLEAALVTANQKVVELQVSASKTRADELQSALDKANERISKLEASLTEALANVTALDARAAKAEKDAEEWKENMKKFKKDATKATRVAKLIKAGLEEALAVEFVDSLGDVTDDVFDAFATMAGSINVDKVQEEPILPVSEHKNIKSVVDKMISKNKNKSGAQVNTVTASQVLENVEEVDNTNENAVASVSDDEAEKTRSAIASFLAD
jgi:hypothetical protein